MELDGEKYEFCSDFRDILEIFTYFNDLDLPDFAKWKIALALFYRRPIPPAVQGKAIAYLAEFIGTKGKPGKPLLDWQQDAPLILADVNKVAGREIRALEYVHWWTFLSWFHGIGDGLLSQVVAIRSRLAQGKKLEDWQAAFYREHGDLVKLRPRLSSLESDRQARLQRLLEGRKEAENATI